MEDEPLLKVDHIDVFYGYFQALWDVSLEVHKGEIVSLIGANGMGKTTILNTISGLIKPKNGQISFKGSNIHRLPPHAIVELGIVQIPEGRRIFPRMNVEDNLIIGSYTHRARTKKNQLLKKVYELFPILEERRKQLGGTLSGGEQQMLAIGRGLMADPQIILLDEISLGIAPILVEKLYSKLEEINREGITELLVEENVDRSLKVCDRAYITRHGRIVTSGTSKELKKEGNITKAYFGA